MSTEKEPEREKSEDKPDQTKGPIDPVARFAQYTAPALLAMLASAGYNTPVAADTLQQ